MASGPASSMPETPAIAARGLGFSYPETSAVVDLDLEVSRGSFFGLLGPNGAGKSTLISLLSGALRPQRGHLDILGRPLEAWPRAALARQVAVVPQRFEISFPFTVSELVLLGRLPHRPALLGDSDEDRAIAERAMLATGVRHLAERRVNELSGGEQKRVLVAKALAQRPTLLLLDEPAAHLDIRHQVALHRLIDEVRRSERLTVVAAMHDLNLAAAFCERVALLQDGRVTASGSIAEVMTYQRLRQTFGIDIYVGVNEITGHRLFTPMTGGASLETAAQKSITKP
ncbi:MAG: ABC transporter ATP-binding protein [Myxococcales bacterium]|nr:ABC transporter ATP-binding protein [Myxococcales bacterium]